MFVGDPVGTFRTSASSVWWKQQHNYQLVVDSRDELEAFLSPLTVQAASPCVWFKRNTQQEVLTRDSTLLNWISHANAVVTLLFGESVQSFVF